jgi:hypothetical protein
MKKKPEPPPEIKPKPKLTDAERHKRFVDMAHEVQADESPEAFDRAFEKVITPRTKAVTHSDGSKDDA